MANLNEVRLIGRIGQIPEISTTKDQKKIAKFSIATTEKWIDKATGQKTDKTEWHKIVVYNAKLAEIIETRKDDLKGASVFIGGKLKYEKWTDASGKEQNSTSIILDMYQGVFQILNTKSKSDDIESKTNHHDESDSDDLPF